MITGFYMNCRCNRSAGVMVVGSWSTKRVARRTRAGLARAPRADDERGGQGPGATEGGDGGHFTRGCERWESLHCGRVHHWYHSAQVGRNQPPLDFRTQPPPSPHSDPAPPHIRTQPDPPYTNSARDLRWPVAAVVCQGDMEGSPLDGMTPNATMGESDGDETPSTRNQFDASVVHQSDANKTRRENTTVHGRVNFQKYTSTQKNLSQK